MTKYFKELTWFYFKSGAKIPHEWVYWVIFCTFELAHVGINIQIMLLLDVLPTARTLTVAFILVVPVTILFAFELFKLFCQYEYGSTWREEMGF